MVINKENVGYYIFILRVYKLNGIWDISEILCMLKKDEMYDIKLNIFRNFFL